MSWIRLFLAPLLIALCTALTPAQAQIVPFQRGEPQLTEGDLAFVEQTTRLLLGRGRIGLAASWANAESGNSGTVSLEEAFVAAGLPCRRFGHVLRFKDEADPRVMNVTLCRVGAEWKIAG